MATSDRPAQLELRHPVSLRESIARECARILAIAEQDAEQLRAAGKAKRADELLADRRRLTDTIKRASRYARGSKRR